MRYVDPIPTEEERLDVGLDEVLKKIRAKIKADIPWVGEYVYLRAYTIFTANSETQDQYIPQVYLGNGEYYDARPNDNIPCSVFFRTNGPVITDFDKTKRGVSASKSLMASRSISLIFWANLERINPDYKSKYIYTEPITREFIRSLKPVMEIQSIDSVYDDNIHDVFEGYTLVVNMLDRKPGSSSYNRAPRNDRKQYSKWPMASLRIDFTVSYRYDNTNCF